MKSDADIKRDVEAELGWDPQVDAKDIAVKVNSGVVTLTGYARSFAQKYRAESTAKRIAGVAAVANDIEVTLPPDEQLTDPQIARSVVARLQADLPVAAESIKALVHQGHVALEGEVEWHYQRERAEAVVRELQGVLSVRNSIRIRSRVAPNEIKRKIEDAFRRSAEVDAAQVSVETQGSQVILRGRVRSWAERDQALQTAWSAPGVTDVKSEITVRI